MDDGPRREEPLGAFRRRPRPQTFATRAGTVASTRSTRASSAANDLASTEAASVIAMSTALGMPGPRRTFLM